LFGDYTLNILSYPMKFTEENKTVPLLFSGGGIDSCHDKGGLEREGGKDRD
jgi:hypothetical protein